MNSKSEFSETEDVRASIITTLTDMLDITYEEPDGNWPSELWSKDLLYLQNTIPKF